ncbi:NAD(P)/FAD-dependent oxidoreductase [Rhodococcus chondri]|uniref:FAD-dependent oxidoreductase n=1 Tax=Rhodococcus chondri TaxID=3065941 RepID=A0ABU7JSM2_9NOCA|nr:FAD-dependent oxidoreductase [Rhodococcus sp. CC-R104]MEE2033026.1 FAD-dependent oxidoreductase [Rhodococcus sp. CC-R104]
MSERHFVVVGASLAGLRAVEAARRSGFDGPITVIGAESHLPYDRPPLSKKYLEPVIDGGRPELPFFRSAEAFAHELDAELILGSPATRLNTEKQEVHVANRVVPYDVLIIATGAHARELPGTQGLAGVHGLRTLDDAEGIRAALEARARTVVIGAGFIGSEVASNARQRGVDVTVVEALPTPLVRAVGPAMGAAVAALHERNGTKLLCGVGVSSVEGDGHVERVVLADGTVLPADLVVVGIGAVPSVEWLEGSGLTLDNGIVCDANLFTGVSGVYAAGDVARWHNPLLGRLQRLEHWTSAAEQGAAAARNALDPAAAKPYSTVPYFWSDWYDSRIQFVGFPDADEVSVVDGDVTTSGKWVALYRKNDRLAGALTVNGQTEIMKYRGLITKQTSWNDALEFARVRREQAAAKLAFAR